ncbi:MAG: RagB/SusD family nutrient uptake outer membrane protein [Bacteroidales bacterium]
MNHIKKILGYLTAGVMLFMIPASCEQDPLDRESVSSFTEESVFEDINLTKSYLGTCYNNIGHSANNVLGLTQDLLSSATDETLCIHRPGAIPFVKGTLSPSELGHFGSNWWYGWLEWNTLYDNIKNVNVLLANIDDVPTETAKEEELKERIKAEAYWIRAFDYTNLLRTYGGVILMEEPFDLGEDFKEHTRSSIAETRDFILSDIEKAIEGLPEKDGIEQGRATKGAAAALKVRLLTFCASDLVNGGYAPDNPLVSFQEGTQQERWEAAQKAAKDFIDGEFGNYGLVGNTQDPPEDMSKEQIQEYATNFHNIFLQKGTWNEDIIWGVQYREDKGNTASPNLWYGPNGYHNWGNNNPTERTVRWFEMADGSEFDWTSPEGVDDETLREATASDLENNPYLDPYYRREPRFYATVLYHGAPWQERPGDVEAPDTIQTGYFVDPGGDYTNDDDITAGVDTRQGPTEAWNGTKTGYYLKKFLDPEIQGQYNDNEQTWPEFRYAEIVLDYAEASIEVGDIQDGIEALNMVRNRAGLPDRPTEVGKDQAREFVRHERKVEFYGEGKRWFDIRRWMIADEVIRDVHIMDIFEWKDGSRMRWQWSVSTIQDDREWKDAAYWMPIAIEEMNRAPQLEQNPGYN